MSRLIRKMQSMINNIVLEILPRSHFLVPQQLLSHNPAMSRYSIGEFSYCDSAPLVLYNDSNPPATLKIGKFCSIARNVIILLGGEHSTDWVTTYPFSAIFEEFKHLKDHPATKGRRARPGSVTIGNNVWIGLSAMILSCVSIGDGAVIGAFSVVTKDVAPYTIVAGNPARVIGQRFDQETIDKLLRIKWWDWDIERIRENMNLMLSNRIDEFIEKNSV